MKHSKLKKIVLIGASTGGPGQINKIIKSLSKLNETSIIIAQHMADGFSKSFMNGFKKSSLYRVEMASDTKSFEINTIYVCENNTKLIKNKNYLFFHKKEKTINSFNPNINLIFNSIVPLCKEIEVLSVILTGIGDDGVDACINLSRNGARCITETSDSAIIDGMPSRARELVPNIEAYHIDDIIKIISEFTDNV